MAKDGGELRKRFDACVKQHLTATHCDTAVASASLERLCVKKDQTLRKSCVSNRARQLYEQRRRGSAKLSEDEQTVAKRAISTSCRDDHREHVNGIPNDVEAAERCGNSREVSRLTRLLSGKRHTRSINPSKDLNGDLLVTQDQLLDEWSKFLGAKFASPDADKNRSLECLTTEDDELGDEEVNKCLEALRSGKAPGCDNVTVEACRGSVEATKELFRICTSCGTPNASRRITCVAYVCNVSQERVTGRLQELPSNLPPVSLLQVDVCHRCTAPDDYIGGPPTRYTGRVQAGTGLQGQRLRP